MKAEIEALYSMDGGGAGGGGGGGIGGFSLTEFLVGKILHADYF
jgi:hypothetical protein